MAKKILIVDDNCSAFIGWEWKEKALRAGMVDYLVKPISLEIIKAKIGEFIRTER